MSHNVSQLIKFDQRSGNNTVHLSTSFLVFFTYFFIYYYIVNFIGPGQSKCGKPATGINIFTVFLFLSVSVKYWSSIWSRESC